MCQLCLSKYIYDPKLLRSSKINFVCILRWDVCASSCIFWAQFSATFDKSSAPLQLIAKDTNYASKGCALRLAERATHPKESGKCIYRSEQVPKPAAKGLGDISRKEAQHPPPWTNPGIINPLTKCCILKLAKFYVRRKFLFVRARAPSLQKPYAPAHITQGIGGTERRCAIALAHGDSIVRAWLFVSSWKIFLAKCLCALLCGSIDALSKKSASSRVALMHNSVGDSLDDTLLHNFAEMHCHAKSHHPLWPASCIMNNTLIWSLSTQRNEKYKTFACITLWKMLVFLRSCGTAHKLCIVAS